MLQVCPWICRYPSAVMFHRQAVNFLWFQPWFLGSRPTFLTRHLIGTRPEPVQRAHGKVHLNSHMEQMTSEEEQMKSHMEYMMSEEEHMRSHIKHMMPEMEHMKSHIEYMMSEMEHMKSHMEHMTSEEEHMKSHMEHLLSRLSGRLRSFAINSGRMKQTKWHPAAMILAPVASGRHSRQNCFYQYQRAACAPGLALPRRDVSDTRHRRWAGKPRGFLLMAIGLLADSGYVTAGSCSMRGCGIDA